MAKKPQHKLGSKLERYGILSGPSTKLAAAIHALNCGPTKTPQKILTLGEKSW